MFSRGHGTVKVNNTRNFNIFWTSDFNMSIKPKEFQAFLNLIWVHDFKMLIKPKEFQWFWCAPLVFHWCNLNMKPSQIGIRCSGTRKCSKRYQIDHFCQGFFSAIQPCEIQIMLQCEILKCEILKCEILKLRYWNTTITNNCMHVLSAKKCRVGWHN